MFSTTPPGQSLQEQIQFARHNFDNHQNLIRLADTKGAAFLTLLIFLGASAIPLQKDAIPRLRLAAWAGAFSSALYVLTGLLFLVGFLWTLLLVYRVMRPRGARYYRSPQRGHELLFYGHVMLHVDQEDYFEAVSKADTELILRNLTDQVFELARICQQKMTYLHAARLPMILAFCSWAANVGLGLWILRWK